MRRRALIFVSAIGAAMLSSSAQAEVTDLEVKAAFLPRFARYVTWPAAAWRGDQPVTLCVIGDDPFGNLLNQSIAGQQVDGRNFVVKRLSSAAGASDCAIAFVDGSRTDEILQSLAHQPVLTVTDSRFGSERGIIHFVIVGGRVRFSINNRQAREDGLTISSRLLALAVGVSG